MNLSNKRESLILFLGDIFFFYFALWVMLFLRYLSLPTKDLWLAHATPFSILFICWAAVFFIAGLYEKHTLIFKSKVSGTIFNAQLFNCVLAVLFFYLISFFGITPKTNLFIYLIISFILILIWRTELFRYFEIRKRQNAVLIGAGVEMRELEQEVNNNSRYNLYFSNLVDLDSTSGVNFQEEVLNRIRYGDISVIAVDFKNDKLEPLFPQFYDLIFSQVRFIDMHKVYEDIFDRIPLSLVKYSWFLENISVSTQKGYDFAKRIMDVSLAIILGAFSFIFYPFVFFAIKIEDGGPIFFVQERFGQNNKTIKLVKFRSMAVHNELDGIAKEPKTTKVGSFLRKTRIDELPQLWNVLRGDLSMIGPRPEIPALVEVYEKEIPYYNIRHLIKPGLSGWAQLYHLEPPRFSAGVDATKKKLSYDLYYIKNRSFILDLKVAIRTIQALLSRGGV